RRGDRRSLARERAVGLRLLGEPREATIDFRWIGGGGLEGAERDTKTHRSAREARYRHHLGNPPEQRPCVSEDSASGADPSPFCVGRVYEINKSFFVIFRALSRILPARVGLGTFHPAHASDAFRL